MSFGLSFGIFGGSFEYVHECASNTLNKNNLGAPAGDNAQAAAQVAHRVGILDYKAGMKPEEKLKFVLDFNASEFQLG